MADVWTCVRCGAATNEEDTHLLLVLGWELVSVEREDGHRRALCPSCAPQPASPCPPSR
jgi:hypothetical protein